MSYSAALFVIGILLFVAFIALKALGFNFRKLDRYFISERVNSSFPGSLPGILLFVAIVCGIVILASFGQLI